MSPITRVQQTDSPPWHFIQPTYPLRVSNPNSPPSTRCSSAPRLYPASVLPCPPSHEHLGDDIQPPGMQNSLGRGKQCLQQSALMVQSRMPSWLGWQLSKEVRQFQLLCRSIKCAAMLGWPAHSLLSSSVHIPSTVCSCASLLACLCTSWEDAATTSAQGTGGREGGWAVQDNSLWLWQQRGCCSITPSSCGPAAETPSSCTGLHLTTPNASATVPQPARQWDFSRVHQGTNMHLPFSTCPTLPVLSLLPVLLLNALFSVLLGSPCLTHWVLTAAAGY